VRDVAHAAEHVTRRSSVSALRMTSCPHASQGFGGISSPRPTVPVQDTFSDRWSLLKYPRLLAQQAAQIRRLTLFQRRCPQWLPVAR